MSEPFGSLEIGSLEVGLLEVGLPEVGSLQIGLPKVDCQRLAPWRSAPWRLASSLGWSSIPADVLFPYNRIHHDDYIPNRNRTEALEQSLLLSACAYLRWLMGCLFWAISETQRL
jgi:hypothetical protein